MEELRILEYINNLSVIDIARVDSESDWQLVIQSFLELIKLLLSLDCILKLDSVIFIELFAPDLDLLQFIVSLVLVVLSLLPLFVFLVLPELPFSSATVCLFVLLVFSLVVFHGTR